MFLLIILANGLVYAAMAASTGELSWDGNQLLAWGGNLGNLSLHGQPWRLLTATYLHAGPQHIIGNLILLGIVGGLVEQRIGSARFLAGYTLCGLAGSLLSAAGHPDVVGIGASGAIAGVLAVVLVLWLAGEAPGVPGRWIAQTVGLNAVYSLAPDVDWLAHLGGFVAGLIGGGVLLAFGWLPPARTGQA